MIRQIEKREIPARVKDAFRGGECYIEISPQRRRNGEARGCEYIACAEAVVRGDSIYIAIYKEKSAAGSLLTRSLWFGENVDVIVRGGEILRLKLIADRSHISGGIFTELLLKQREENAAADIGAVWEMSLVSFEALPAMPEGEYTKEEMGFFEIHLDNPRIKKQDEKKAVTGCRFSLAPMSDDFINIILSSIADVDTSKVWSSTDEFSTVYHGRRVHVLDALKACFIRSFRQGVHMAMNALIPEIARELEDAKLAYKVRGINVGRLSLKPFFAAMVNCIRWSENLAMAMESKGFDGDGARTFDRTLRVHFYDIIYAVILPALVLAGTLLVKY